MLFLLVLFSDRHVCSDWPFWAIAENWSEKLKDVCTWLQGPYLAWMICSLDDSFFFSQCVGMMVKIIQLTKKELKNYSHRNLQLSDKLLAENLMHEFPFWNLWWGFCLHGSINRLKLCSPFFTVLFFLITACLALHFSKYKIQ